MDGKGSDLGCGYLPSSFARMVDLAQLFVCAALSRFRAAEAERKLRDDRSPFDGSRAPEPSPARGLVAADLTAGNGRDTLFLARAVGEGGRVWAFDLQGEAIRRTEARLREAGLLGRVTLVRADHAELARHVREPLHAAMMNLGYLPGGDPTLVTHPPSTLRAVEETLRLLVPGGILTVVAYPGHPGGEEEAEALLAFARRATPHRARVVRSEVLGTKDPAPFLLVWEAV
ncbi:tRNA (mnm(5)s(2)U34)-methyltransferase [Brockia lithotrophica]|uniref:tRNA (mnm(5)s(2)U34)-methyltransferase n=1 Tax=Brockia lithotrophica TaxID=933949 RepID=UPI001B86778C|nr:class I SAM-dependent methyltransferase [Brockia lithotrophica]